MSSSETYILMHDLIESEKQLLQVERGSFDFEKIYIKLRAVTGKSFSSDLNVWIDWFINDPYFCEEEKKSINIVYRLLEIEKNSMSKLNKKNLLKE
ncbi:MAG TPA: hypothetical protein VL995_04145 [Cellvibrio sp.]|nr:hypothetical protein [Cellvibrio sp.]